MKYIISIYLLLIGSFINAQEGCFDTYFEVNLVCSGEEFSLGAFNTDGSNTATYQWTLDGDLVNSTDYFYYTVYNNDTVAIELEFILEATGSSGCSDIDTLVITVFPTPPIDVTVNNILCANQTGSLGSIVLNGYDSINSLNYMNSSTGQFNSVTSQTISGLTQGAYQVFLTDTNYCSSDTLNVQITIPLPITLDSLKILNDNCGQGTGRVTLLGLTGGVTPYTFIDANSNQYVSFNDSIIVGIMGSPSLSFITVNDANNCQYDLTPNGIYIDSNDFDVPESPVYDSPYTLCENDSLVLFDQESTNTDSKHYFSFTNGSLFNISNNNPVTLNNIPTIFDTIQVKVEGKVGEVNEGCFSEFSYIELTHIECQDSINTENTVNAFSPNSTLVENSTFQIDLKYIEDELINNIKVKIYNRWGDVVNEFDNYNNESNVWHGDNIKGEELPEGTYFYTIQIPSQSYSTSGWVYLDRKQ